MSFELTVLISAFGVMLASYLLGSVNPAIIFTHVFKKTDIREHGSGNAGFTNVIRSAGVVPALLTLLGDTAKTALSCGCGYLVFISLEISQKSMPLDPIYGTLLGGLFCFIGHIFPVYYRFKGGKGVLALFAIMLFVDYKIFFCVLAIFLIVFMISRIISLSSLLSLLCYPVISYFMFELKAVEVMDNFRPFLIKQRDFEVIMASIFVLIVYIKHIPNIKRLLKGEEKRLKLKKD